MWRRHNIFKFLWSKDINSNKMTLSMSVLSSLGSWNFNNLIRTTINNAQIMNNEVEKPDLIIEIKTITNNYLAGTVFDNDVSILTNGTSLLRISFGCTSISLGFKLVLFVRHLVQRWLWRWRRAIMRREICLSFSIERERERKDKW